MEMAVVRLKGSTIEPVSKVADEIDRRYVKENNNHRQKKLFT